MTVVSIAWRMCLCLLLLVTAAAVYRTAFITLPEIQRSAAELPAALAGAETDLVNESAAWRVTADRQATEYRAALEGQVSLARAGLLAELRPVTQQAAQTLAAYQGIPEAAGPVLASATRALDAAPPLVADARNFLGDIRPQMIGLVAGWKVVGGETATTMRDFRRATPKFIEGVDTLVTNSNRTTAATAATMRNFQEATRPLPRWLRIGLGVAPPLAQTAAGVATAFALTGR